MTAQLVALAFDAITPNELARFWAACTGLEDPIRRRW